MTRFSQELRDIAEQAPHLGDIADRALASARLRRRLIIPLTAGGAVATVAALAVLIGSVLPGLGQVIRPASEGPFPSMVLLPDEAEPLPAKGVGRAMFSYEYCPPGDPGKGFTAFTPNPSCRYRILTVDGRAYESPVRNRPISVSPDGRRIGYLDKERRFVVRDLASGDRSTVLRWDGRDLPGSVLWSADGKRLLVQPGEIPHGGCDGPDRSLLVDIATRKSTAIPGCRVYGLTDKGAPFPDRTKPGSKEIPMFGHDGTLQDTIPAYLLEGTADHWDEETIGSISPDGKQFAILIPEHPAERGTGARLRRIDIEAQRQETVGIGSMESGQIEGWADERRLVTSTGIAGPDLESTAIHTVEVGTGKVRQVVEVRNANDVMIENVAYRLLGQR